MPPDPFAEYLKAIRTNLGAGDATEHTHRPALAALIQALGTGVQAINEPKHRTDCGAPDIRVRRKGLTLGYIECKDIGVSLDDAERSDQVQRYLKHLPNLVLNDYLEFRWYADGKLRQEARAAYLAPGGKVTPDRAGTDSARELLGAFLQHQPEEISKPKELAERMAPLTHAIRDMIVQAFERGDASTMLAGLHDAFQRTLIPDLPVAEFADMFAQTLAYGLFAARCNHPGPGPFQRLGAAAEIPKTNPFLRQLFDTITGVDLDDEPFVGFVDDLVDLLAYSDIGAILRDFGKRTRREDPVVHFYETFLGAYDPKKRKARGVYYTPEPVVSYIVRSVDYLLRTRFGCPDGLADKTKITYEREERRGDELVKVQDSAPRVLILDPACGTGTFLYSIVDHIRSEFQERGDAGMWSGYVREHLLPRLFGFELLMAPYAVAHLKLGMQLAAQDMPEGVRQQWAYDFSGHERLGVYLTNTLERAERQAENLFGPMRVITEEANAAGKIKRDLPIMVVLGNPPYSSASANRGPWITELLETYKTRVRREETQIQALSDDYVKFVRFAQWRIEATHHGVVALITNNGYLDGLIFRDMRAALLRAFDEVYVLNLHGNARKKEKAPDGREDQNVFDIQQGVAIAILVRHSDHGPDIAQVHYADLWGDRESKYEALASASVDSVNWAVILPEAPSFTFVPHTDVSRGDYDSADPLTLIFGSGNPATDKTRFYGTGFKTQQDEFAIAFDADTLRRRIEELLHPRCTEADLRSRYQMCRTAQWDFGDAREALAARDWNQDIRRCLYRPFDFRYTVFTRAVVTNPRHRTMDHLLRPNIALCVGHAGQAVATESWDLLFVASTIEDQNLFHRGGNMAFPLYLYEARLPLGTTQTELAQESETAIAAQRRPNLNPGFIRVAQDKLKLLFLTDGRGDLEKTFGPEDVFHYIYAVLHSPTYRQRYAEFLKTDFPRVPLTSNLDLFRALTAKGADLVALHLMEDDYPAASWQAGSAPQGSQIGNLRHQESLPNQNPFASLVTRFPVPGDNLVDKGYPRYFPPGHRMATEPDPLAAGRVCINAEDSNKARRAQYFEGVPPEVWEFHVGGYQVCDKWLKDRRGRQLSYDDLTHYQRIVVALNETIRLMAEIDQAIDAHGGWPDAFAARAGSETMDDEIAFELDRSLAWPVYSTVCSFCRHLGERNPHVAVQVCAAFPDGIPEDIWFGRNKHLKPYPNDHGIHFEARPEVKPKVLKEHGLSGG